MKKMIFCAGMVLALSVLAIVGCQKGGLKGLVPVEGVVLYNGSPVEGASVRFAPDPQGEGSRSAQATTDAEGKFKLMTLNPGDGAAPGNYKVAIQKMTEPPRPEGTEGMSDGELAQFDYMKDEVESLLPVKYSASASSGLTATVPAAGIKDLKFELVD